MDRRTFIEGAAAVVAVASVGATPSLSAAAPVSSEYVTHWRECWFSVSRECVVELGLEVGDVVTLNSPATGINGEMVRVAHVSNTARPDWLTVHATFVNDEEANDFFPTANTPTIDLHPMLDGTKSPELVT